MTESAPERRRPTPPAEREIDWAKWRSVGSMALEAVTPTVVADFLRDKRGGTTVSDRTAGTISERPGDVLSTAEVVGGAAAFEGSNVGLAAAVVSKVVEYGIIAKRKRDQRRDVPPPPVTRRRP